MNNDLISRSALTAKGEPMAEYIEREAAKRYLAFGNACPDTVLYLLDEVDAADVAPVVHGEWVDHLVRDWRCSECGEPIKKVRNVDGYCYDDKPNYCPNCGADMRERKGDYDD